MQIPWTQAEIDKAVALVKAGSTAAQIAAALENRTRNAVIGLLHRRKVQMSIMRPKPYPTKPPPKPRKPSPPQLPQTTKTYESFDEKSFIPTKVEGVPYGKIHILDAHRSQCRWIDGDKSSFICGEPTVNQTSWCGCHYKRVFTPSAVAKALSNAAKEKKIAERWNRF